MAVKLGSTVQELIDAVNDALQVPSNMMTTDTSQTINAAKTFAEEVAFDNHIRANGGVGTAGQVLTSQGANKAPIWKTPSGGSTDKEFYYINGSTAAIANMTKDGIYVWTPGSVSTATFKYTSSSGFALSTPNNCVIYILVTREKYSSGFYNLCWQFYFGDTLYHGEALILISTGALQGGTASKVLGREINSQNFLSSDGEVTLFDANVGGTVTWYGSCDVDGNITFTLSDNNTTPTRALVTISDYTAYDPICVNITRNGVLTLMEITTYNDTQRAILDSSYVYEVNLEVTYDGQNSFTFEAFRSSNRGGSV